MNISQFAAINKSLQSRESTPSQHNNISALSFNHQPSLAPIFAPENGGILKPSMIFQYQFSSPKKSPQYDTDQVKTNINQKGQ